MHVGTMWRTCSPHDGGGMTTRRTLLAAVAALALLLLTACAGASAPPPPPPEEARQASSTAHDLTRDDLDSWLDGFVPATLEREGIPGASVAVVRDGKVVSTRGFGWADREKRTPVDPKDTLFRVGSVSKLFTATAVMQLVERGDVDLDTDVEEYVDVDLEKPVTLRQLLSHTGGFEERVSGLIQPPDATVDLRRTLEQDPPRQIYEPGTVPAYSNYGNALAGLVVQEVSGQRFEDYVAEHVLRPVGMTSSSFAQPLPGPLAERLARGYADTSSDPTPFEVVGPAPAGALTASADDMARFMIAQLGHGDALLRPRTLATMHAPALDRSSLGGLAEAPRMTLGFFDRSRNGHRALEHGGDTTVFHSDLEIWPDDDTGIFVSVNGSGREAMSTARLRDGLLEGFADRYLPGDEADPAAGAGSTKRAEALAGTYESSRTVRSTFLAAAYASGQTSIEPRPGGRILVSPGPNAAEPATFEEVRPWVWREVDGYRTLAARVDDGRVEAIAFDNAFALLPVPAHRSAGVLLPVVGGSVLVLVLGAVGWAAAYPVRWVRRTPRRDRTGRGLRVLTRVGVGSALLALAGWVVVLTQVMGLGEPPSTTSIRVVQVLQVIGLLGVVPALLRLLDEVRRRVGWLRVAATGLVTASLVGVGWGAVTLHLLSTDLSY